jgi:ketosteroid isomerase-like protein
MGNKIAGISGFAQSDVKIHNNLILNSGQLGIGAQPSCRLFVKDNIIQDNPRGIVVFLREGDKRGNLRIRENTFWNNGTDTENCEKAPQSISEQLVFNDPNNGDFSLRPGPVLEQKQGLANPEVFKALWERWKNREDKNEPFTEKVLSMTAVQKTDVQVEVLKQIETITDVLIQAFNAGDIDTILSYYTDDVMSLPDQHEAAIGKGALHKLQLEAREEGVKIHSIKGLEQQIWDCGDFVFEAGRYVASMKSPKLRYLLSDWRKSVTVWARQPDGSLKIKLDSWNPDVIPDANVAPASPVVTVVASGSSSDSDMEAIYAQIKQKESTFHKAFIAHDAEAAIKFYADDAIIMSWGKDAIRGKADISSDIRKSMGEEPLVDMTQHVIHIEGNDKMLFAVNLFTWTFKDKSSGENVTLPGKGVHVWKRQQDGSWKILLDLYNPSVPIQQQGQS